YSPLALWMGARYFVLYGLELTAPVASGVSGVLLDSGPSISVKQTPRLSLGGSFNRFGAAMGAGTITAAWVSSDTERVNVMQTALDGTPLETSFLLARPGARAADIAWDGSEFVLVWTEGAPGGNVTLRGLRLGAHLDPIDGEPFDVADDLGPYAATVVSTS